MHGLNTKTGGQGIAEILRDKKKEYKVDRPFVEISSGNYKIIQVHKNFEDYKNRDTE